MQAEGLIQRLITALLAAVTVVAVLFFAPRLVGVIFLAAVVVVGAWEWGGFFATIGRAGRLAYVALILAGLVFAWWMAAPSPLAWMWAASAWWLVAFVLVLRYPVDLPQWFIAIAGPMVLVPGWLALAHLHMFRGPEWIMFFFVLIAAADTGAYFTGRALGRTRLAPQVSPGKTWEGAAGGLAMVTVVAAAGAWWFGLATVFLIPLALAVALISIVGDLTISIFKRNAGLKDSGNLFPGHGGVMDRVDSMAAGAPLFVIGLGWTQHIT